jgi:O-antigen ligase
VNRSLFFSRFYYLLFGIAVISLPFTSLLYFFITPLLLIFWIIEGEWKNKWNRLKESQTLVITCFFVLFWLIHVIGLFYSNDLIKGMTRTYDKLPFLVYPLVFFTLNKTYFTQKKLLTLFKGFICATAIMLIISWGNALVQYFTTGDTNYFYYIHFSKLFGHPSYCALKVCIAFTITFFFLTVSLKSQRATTRVTPTVYRVLFSALLFFFAVSIYFFQSRTGILVFIVVLLFSVFYFLHIQKKSYLYGIVGVLAVLLITVAIVKLLPNRMENNLVKVSSGHLQTKSILGIRGDIWNTTYQLAMENKMLGIGSGYHPESYLTEEGLAIIGKHSSFINAHNQFLQTFLEHGIVGFLLLVFLIIYSFYFAIKTKNYLLFMLMINIGINIFFESMFERSHGIFTFNLFYCLFIVKNNIFASDSKIVKL